MRFWHDYEDRPPRVLRFPQMPQRSPLSFQNKFISEVNGIIEYVFSCIQYRESCS